MESAATILGIGALIIDAIALAAIVWAFYIAFLLTKALRKYLST